MSWRLLVKRNLLMVAGPTEIDKEVLSAGAKPMVYNRTPEFSAFLLEIEKNLKHIYKTENDVIILSASGTGAMEAAVVNLLSAGDEAVVIDGGTFGRRWHEIARRYNVNCSVIEMEQGKTVSADMIKKAITPLTKTVFVTANETSTGVLTDLSAIGPVVKDTNAVLVVDAVSSLCADRLETDAWHCDVVITSSQKALALPPGLSFITLSQKAWRLVHESKIPKYYFDLKAYKDNLGRGQTPFTPAISILYQLDIRLKEIVATGLEVILESQRAKSIYLRTCLAELGLTVIGENPSNGVVGIRFPPEIDAYSVVQTLRNEHSIEITPSPGADKYRIARVGLFGQLERADIDKLMSSLKKVLASY